MKILNIHDYPPTEGGGVEINVSRVGMELAKQGIDYKIITSRKSSSVLKSQNAFDDYELNEIKIKIVNKLSELKSEILKADIVNIHLSFSLRPLTIMAIELCVELGVKAIISIRTTCKHIPFSAVGSLSPIEKEFQLLKLAKMLNQPNFTISAPAFCLNETLDFLNINKSVNVIRNGITGLNKHDNSIFDTIEDVDITYVGNISILKNVEGLVEAFAKLVKQITGLKLRIVGNGEQMNEIIHKIEYFGLENNIEVIGYVENKYIPNYLLKTKMLVHPSLSESWCNSVAEALAYGVPVIASNVEGIAELTQNGEFANLVEPGDAESLYSEINNVLTVEDELNNLKAKSLKAQVFVRKNYTLENQASNLIRLYKSIL